MDVVVCFTAGSGGNFVAAMCQWLVTGRAISISDNGDCQKKIQYQTPNEPITAGAVTLGHDCNVNRFIEAGRKVIYISFDENDYDTIMKRLSIKSDKCPVTEELYNACKTTKWPQYEDWATSDFKVPQRFFETFFKDWKWIMPETTASVHEIKFSSLLGESTKWIDDLAQFMECSNTQYLMDKFTEYKQSNG